VRLAARAVRGVTSRWLVLANASAMLFLGLPFFAPVLAQHGRMDLAAVIYDAFQLTCHEWPFRTYFLFGPQATYTAAELQSYGVQAVHSFRGSSEIGYKVALCSRNVAIYGGAVAAGLAYAGARSRLAPLSFGGYCGLIAPLALDGLSQLAGWRESTWELRTVTGGLFGVASVWLLYPRVDVVLGRIPAQRPALTRPEGSAA
jgi:uncharacterized membrane protein